MENESAQNQQHETGDPNETRTAIARLREKEGQEILLASLLRDLGRQLMHRRHWDEAEASLMEAWKLVEHDHNACDEQGKILFDLGELRFKRGNAELLTFSKRQACELLNAHLGAEHPDTLSARSSLADALAEQGKFAEAEEEHRAVLAIRVRECGAEHPDTLSSQKSLNVVRAAQGKHAQPVEEHRGHIETEERAPAPEHTGTSPDRGSIASTPVVQEKNTATETAHREPIETGGDVFDSEHSDVFLSAFNLALRLAGQKKWTEALVFAKRAEMGWKKNHGENHPHVQAAVRLHGQIEAELQKQKPAK